MSNNNNNTNSTHLEEAASTKLQIEEDEEAEAAIVDDKKKQKKKKTKTNDDDDEDEDSDDDDDDDDDDADDADENDNDNDSQTKKQQQQQQQQARLPLPSAYKDAKFLDSQYATSNLANSDVSLLIFTANESYGPNMRESILIGALQSQYQGKLCIHYVSRKEVAAVSKANSKVNSSTTSTSTTTTSTPQQQEQQQQQQIATTIATIEQVMTVDEESNNAKPVSNLISLELVAQYDCLLFETFGGIFTAHSDSLGDLFAQYVEQCAGGVLCMAVSNDNSYGIGGTFKTRGYHPLQYTQGYNYDKLAYDNYLGAVLVPEHPIMQNVVKIHTGEWCGHSLCGISDDTDSSEGLNNDKEKHLSAATLNTLIPMQQQQVQGKKTRAVPPKVKSKVELIAQWRKTNAPLVAVKEIQVADSINTGLILDTMKRIENAAHNKQLTSNARKLLNQITNHNAARVVTINCGAANRKVQKNYWEIEDTDLPILMFNALMYASRRRTQVRKHLGSIIYSNAEGKFDKVSDILIETRNAIH